jgi:pilus assembly protein CpaB
MNSRALIPLIAGLCIGGLALKLGLDFVQRAKGAQGTPSEVWVAERDIPRWTKVDDSMLKAIGFPSKAVPPGAFADKEKLIGRVLRMTAPANLPVLESMLLPPGEKPGLHVPTGLRAVAVKIDEGSGVDYHLQPGCRVDVIGYFSVRKSGETQLISRTVVEDVEVGAVGAQLTAINPAENEEPGKSGGRQQKVRAVTLFVEPADVPLLHMAEQKGKIKLAMRGSGDGGATDELPQVTDRQLYGEGEADREAENEQPGLLSSFFAALSKPQQPDLEVGPSLPAVLPQSEPQPQPVVWRMRVWNGDRLLTLGWPRMDSIEALDLTSADLARGKPEVPSVVGRPAALAVDAAAAGQAPRTGQSTSMNEPTDAAADGDAEPTEEPELEELEE